MITINSFATAQSLLQRLKSDNSKSDLYEGKYDSVVSLFKTWLNASDQVAIGELECVIQNDIRNIEEALSPPAISTTVETNNITAETKNSQTAATVNKYDPSPPSDASSSEECGSPFDSYEDELPKPILASYERLCPGGFDRGDDELTEEATDSDTNPETNAGSNRRAKPTKRRRRKGPSTFKPKSKYMNEAS